MLTIRKNAIRYSIYLFNKKIFSVKRKIDKRFYTSCDIKNIKQILSQDNHFDHPVGIVISQYATIGHHNRIYQNVTIGTTSVAGYTRKEYPVIGNNNVICANAIIVGKIKIGNNCIIGANAFVNCDIPDNTLFISKNKIKKIPDNYYYNT